MELSCFGWVGGTGGGGGGGISGSGTANTVAMFTGATSIGDSCFYQSDTITSVSTIQAGVTDSFAIGLDNEIDIEQCYVFGARNQANTYSSNMLLGYDLTSTEIENVIIGNTNKFATQYAKSGVIKTYVNTITEEQYAGFVATSDASAGRIILFTPIEKTVYLVEVYITCIKTGGTGAGTIFRGNSYILTAQVESIGGVATIGTIQNTYTYEVNTAYSVTLSDGGAGDLVVRVLGDVDDDVDWNAFSKVYSVFPTP
jgi:hypothetical protein